MTPIDKKPRKGDVLYLKDSDKPAYFPIKITGWLHDKPQENTAHFEYCHSKKPGNIVVCFNDGKTFNSLLFNDI